MIAAEFLIIVSNKARTGYNETHHCTHLFTCAGRIYEGQVLWDRNSPFESEEP